MEQEVDDNSDSVQFVLWMMYMISATKAANLIENKKQEVKR